MTDEYPDWLNLYFLVSTVAWSPDCTKIAVGSYQYTETGITNNSLLNILDSATNQVIQTLISDSFEYAMIIDYVRWSSRQQQAICAHAERNTDL